MMTEDIKKLLRKNSLRKAAAELSVDELVKLYADLSEIIEERKAQEAELLEAQRKKDQRLSEIHKMMSEAGLSLDDLDSALSGLKPKKTTVAAKYQITDSEGNVHKWSGRGRTPKAFQIFFDQGGTKEDCLIKA